MPLPRSGCTTGQFSVSFLFAVDRRLQRLSVSRKIVIAVAGGVNQVPLKTLIV